MKTETVEPTKPIAIILHLSCGVWEETRKELEKRVEEKLGIPCVVLSGDVQEILFL